MHDTSAMYNAFGGTNEVTWRLRAMYADLTCERTEGEMMTWIFGSRLL